MAYNRMNLSTYKLIYGKIILEKSIGGNGYDKS